MPVALLTWHARPRGAWRALGVADERASQPNGFRDVLKPRDVPKTACMGSKEAIGDEEHVPEREAR